MMANFIDLFGTFINLGYVAKIAREPAEDPFFCRHTFFDAQGMVLATAEFADGDTAVQRAVLDKVLPAPLGFLALRVRAGFQVTSVPVVAIRVAQNRYSNVENFPVTAVGADS